MSDTRHAEDHRIVLEIAPGCYSRTLLYRGRLPGLVIVDGVDELVITAGPRLQDAVLAKEFAIGLASNALAFAGQCNRRLTPDLGWPSDDPEREGEDNEHDF